MRLSSISIQVLLLQKSFFLSSAFLSSSSNRHHEIISSNTFTSIASNNPFKSLQSTSLKQSSTYEELFVYVPSFNGQLELPYEGINWFKEDQKLETTDVQFRRHLQTRLLTELGPWVLGSFTV